jgi:hypothetical protein
VNEADYRWLPDWPHCPGEEFFRTIKEPFNLEELRRFLIQASSTFGHNYGGFLMAFGSAMSLCNFRTFIDCFECVNLPYITGPSMTGKTLAGTCIVLILGMNKSQISSR